MLDIMCRIWRLSLPLITSLPIKNILIIHGVPAASATLNTLSPISVIACFSELLNLRGTTLRPRAVIKLYITTAIIVAGSKAIKNNPQSGSTVAVSQINRPHNTTSITVPTIALVLINFWKYTPVIARTAWIDAFTKSILHHNYTCYCDVIHNPAPLLQ